MKNFDKVNKITVLYYDQFEQIGELYDDCSIDRNFLWQSRRFFAKQYFFELKLIFKAENRQIKHDFNIQKKLDIKRFKKNSKEIK